MSLKLLLVLVICIRLPTAALAQTQAPLEQKRDWQQELMDLREMCATVGGSVMKQLIAPIQKALSSDQSLPALVISGDASRYARIDLVAMRITISTGQCIEVAHMALAAATFRMLPLDMGRMFRYIAYLQKKQDMIARMSPVDAERAVLEYFPGWSGVRDLPAFKIHEDKIFDDSLSMLFTGLGWLILHEVAHIARSHRPLREITHAIAIKQEIEADKFAFETIRNEVSDHDLARATPLLLAVLERQRRETQKGEIGGQSHPAADCRLVYLFNHSALLRTIGAQSGYDKWLLMAGLIKRLPDTTLAGDVEKFQPVNPLCE